MSLPQDTIDTLVAEAVASYDESVRRLTGPTLDEPKVSAVNWIDATFTMNVKVEGQSWPENLHITVDTEEETGQISVSVYEDDSVNPDLLNTKASHALLSQFANPKL